MRQPVKVSSPVVDPEMPIFGSRRATSKPGVSDSTTKAEIPEWPFVGSVFANTVYSEATAALVMKRFEPSRMYSRVAPRLGAHCRRVRARARLGERARASHSPESQPGQVELLLLLGAAELEPERAQRLHREDQPARRADLGHLLDRDQRQQHAGARAPVVLVEEETEELVLAEKLDEVPRELVRLVDLRRPRRDPLPRSVRTRSRISRCSSLSTS